MKRQLICLAVTIILALSLSSSASAQNAQGETWGAGVVAGDPFGLSGKYWVDKTQAIDAAAGWDVTHTESFELYADYLFHNFEMLSIKERPVALFFGAGPRFTFNDQDHDGDTSFGLRLPVGLTYLLPHDPIEMFGEIVPGMDLAPSSQFKLQWGLGVRFYFK